MLPERNEGENGNGERKNGFHVGDSFHRCDKLGNEPMPKLLHDATGDFKAEEEGSTNEETEERVRNDGRSIVPG